MTRKTGTGVVIVTFVMLVGASAWFAWRRCGQDPFPNVLVADEPAQWNRALMLERFGKPTEHETGPPKRLLLARDHSYQVTQLLEAAQPNEDVELVVWRSYCRGALRAEMAALFDPSTGRFRTTLGKPLFDLYRIE